MQFICFSAKVAASYMQQVTDFPTLDEYFLWNADFSPDIVFQEGLSELDSSSECLETGSSSEVLAHQCPSDYCDVQESEVCCIISSALPPVSPYLHMPPLCPVHTTPFRTSILPCCTSILYLLATYLSTSRSLPAYHWGHAMYAGH